jgi:hypothetical protein
MIKHGTTNEVTRKIARSKFATDIMYRLWDAHNHCWITSHSRSIWSSLTSVEKIRERLIDAGRDPSTITVERVFVEIPHESR